MVNGRNAGVLELAGDGGFFEKLRGVRAALVKDFDCHIAAERGHLW